MTKIPCLGTKFPPSAIAAWAPLLGISSEHQVANDAKTGSSATAKQYNQGLYGGLAGEPRFQHDFKILEGNP
jgi:hypothetical protein